MAKTLLFAFKKAGVMPSEKFVKQQEESKKRHEEERAAKKAKMALK